jgi:hypothetical protein
MMPSAYDMPHGGAGRLVLDVSGPILAPKRFSTIPYIPKVSINGQSLIPARRGQTMIDLHTGHYHLDVGIGASTTSTFHYGRARVAARVLAGQTTTVYYRAPAVIWVAGRIGFAPQTTPGRAQRACLIAFIGMLVLAGLLTVLR